MKIMMGTVKETKFYVLKLLLIAVAYFFNL